jgi:hypothetical protein
MLLLGNFKREGLGLTNGSPVLSDKNFQKFGKLLIAAKLPKQL